MRWIEAGGEGSGKVYAAYLLCLLCYLLLSISISTMFALGLALVIEQGQLFFVSKSNKYMALTSPRPKFTWPCYNFPSKLAEKTASVDPSYHYYWVLEAKPTRRVLFDPDSESGVRIQNACFVTEIQHILN